MLTQVGHYKYLFGYYNSSGRISEDGSILTAWEPLAIHPWVRANRILMGLGRVLRRSLRTFYFMVMKTNNSTTRRREILSNQYSISGLLFTELSLCVSPRTLGKVGCRSQQIPKSKGANPAVPLRPLSE